MNTSTASAPEPRNPAAPRSISEFPQQAARAVELLTLRMPGFSLTREEAVCIVSLMRLVHYPASATLFSAGDAENAAYMLMVLEGDVSVDTGAVGRGPRVDISVMGPGSMLGELSLIDGSPRSATCTAVSAVTAAGLSAGGFQRLAEQFPKVAFKLAVYIARVAADRLRALTEQLQMYDQITNSLQTELDLLRGQVRRSTDSA